MGIWGDKVLHRYPTSKVIITMGNVNNGPMESPSPEPICFVLSIILIISALSLMMAGYVIGNHYRRVLKVNQWFFFWIGRDRVVADVGRICKITGAVLLVLGLLAMWTGLLTY